MALTISSPAARYSFLLGLALIALGIGNLTVGVLQGQEYERVLEEARAELRALPPVTSPPLLSFPTNIDRQTEYIERLEVRLGFYRIVVLGGKCFLALAGVSLLVTFVALSGEPRRRKAGEAEKAVPPIEESLPVYGDDSRGG